MKEKDFIQILQCYRHDLMNDLQVIQGYLSMDKIDKVKTKVNDTIESYNEERKLVSLNTPEFILWVIQFNHLYDNIRLTYQINIENMNLLAIDTLLVNQCKQIIKRIGELGVKAELYEVKLQLNLQSNSEVFIVISVDGVFDDKKYLIKDLEELKVKSSLIVKETEFGILCEFSYSV